MSVIKNAPDYRSKLGRIYSLPLLLFSLLLTELNNCREQRERAIWLKGNWEWICDLWYEQTQETPLPISSPSQATLCRLLRNVNGWAVMQSFYHKLIEDVQAESTANAAQEESLNDQMEPLHFSIDGKARSGIVSQQTGRTESDVAILDIETRTVISKRHIPDTKGEPTVAREMMISDGHKFPPAVISCDAGFASPEFLKSTVSAGHEYILGLKGNAGSIHDYCLSLNWGDFPELAKTQNKGHGRRETRTLKRFSPGNGIFHDIVQYENASYIFCLRSERLIKNVTSSETRYFIGSKGLQGLSPEKILDMIRAHWIQENGLHWVKDAVLGEDHLSPQSAKGSRLLGFMKDITVGVGFSLFKSVRRFVNEFRANPRKMMTSLLKE